LRLSCPTEGCNSIPMDWVLPTDEILAFVEIAAATRHVVASPDVPGRDSREGLASQLRKLAMHLKQGF